jgi:hypothetical protein
MYSTMEKERIGMKIIGSTLEFANLFHTVAVRPARLSFLDVAKTS